MISGGYSFKLISFNTLIAIVFWMLMPVAIQIMCRQLLQQIPSTNVTEPSVNLSANAVSFFHIASFSYTILQYICLAVGPPALAFMFDVYQKCLMGIGSQKADDTKASECVSLLVCSTIFLAGSSVAMILDNFNIYIRFFGYFYAILLFGLPALLQVFFFLFVNFQLNFLAGSVMTSFTKKCSSIQDTPLGVHVKNCLRNYNLLQSGLAPLLLILISLDTLLLMLNAFMMYMGFSYHFYLHAAMFTSGSLSGILYLIYICLLCDKCFAALNSLLIPLR